MLGGIALVKGHKASTKSMSGILRMDHKRVKYHYFTVIDINGPMSLFILRALGLIDAGNSNNTILVLQHEQVTGLETLLRGGSCGVNVAHPTGGGVAGFLRIVDSIVNGNDGI